MKEEALRLAYKLEESARFVYEMILERDHDSEIAKQLYMAQVKMAKEDENLAKVLRFLLAELDKKDKPIKPLSDEEILEQFQHKCPRGNRLEIFTYAVRWIEERHGIK